MLVLTAPGSGLLAGAVGAGVADREEDLVPATGGVAPAARVEDQRALRAVRQNEAVHQVVDLTPVSTTLVQVTHQLLRTRAVLRVLQHQSSDCIISKRKGKFSKQRALSA